MSSNQRVWAGVGVLAVVLAGVGLAAGRDAEQHPAPGGKAAGTFTVDPVHSNVVYTIRHLGASNHRGVFFGPTGSFSIDAASPASSSISVTVPLSGLSSGDPKRDAHLRTPDFFSAAEFPTITFTSTSFKSAGEGTYEVAGTLGLHGKTRPVTATLSVVGSGKGMQGGEVMGVEAALTIKRTDFGMDKYVKEGVLGDDVSLIVALEGGRK